MLFFILAILLLPLMITRGLLVVPLGQELFQHTLDVVEGLLFSPGCLLLSLHTATEIFIIIIGYVD